MRRLYLPLSFILAGIILTACAATIHSQRPVEFQTEYLIPHGKQIYVEYCAECHQMDGTGWSTLIPPLAHNPIVTLEDPSPLIETVVYGQGSMMAFGDKLNSEDIAAVLSYIRNAWGNHAPAVSPRQIQ